MEGQKYTFNQIFDLESFNLGINDLAGEIDKLEKKLKDLQNIKGGKVTGGDYSKINKEISEQVKFKQQIQKLEDVGIGRPATYATIPKTLIARGYVILEKKKNIIATDLGIKVCDFLVAANFCFIDINFTAELEGKLDDIANGKLDKLTALTEFWERLKQDINNSKSVKKEINKTGHDCPKCGSPLVQKHSKFGDFISCSNYPECKGIYVINENNEPVEKVAKKKEYSTFPCPKCGSKMVKRKSKYGEFLGCEKYPTCKSILDTNGNEVKKSSGDGNKPFKKYKKYKKKK